MESSDLDGIRAAMENLTQADVDSFMIGLGVRMGIIEAANTAKVEYELMKTRLKGAGYSVEPDGDGFRPVGVLPAHEAVYTNEPAAWIAARDDLDFRNAVLELANLYGMKGKLSLE